MRVWLPRWGCHRRRQRISFLGGHPWLGDQFGDFAVVWPVWRGRVSHGGHANRVADHQRGLHMADDRSAGEHRRVWRDRGPCHLQWHVGPSRPTSGRSAGLCAQVRHLGGWHGRAQRADLQRHAGRRRHHLGGGQHQRKRDQSGHHRAGAHRRRAPGPLQFQHVHPASGGRHPERGHRQQRLVPVRPRELQRVGDCARPWRPGSAGGRRGNGWTACGTSISAIER